MTQQYGRIGETVCRHQVFGSLAKRVMRGRQTLAQPIELFFIMCLRASEVLKQCGDYLFKLSGFLREIAADAG